MNCDIELRKTKLKERNAAKMSTGNSLSVKTIQVPLFDRTSKSFSLFWTKFKVLAGMKGFQKALKECPEKELPLFEE